MTTRQKEKELCEKYGTIEDIIAFDEDGGLKDKYKNLSAVEVLANLSLFMENENWHGASETLMNIAHELEFGKTE